MDKLKIESITSIKELSFDINQFDIPKVFFVDFTDVRFKDEYEKLNGENRRTDKINEIIVKAINSEVYDKDDDYEDEDEDMRDRRYGYKESMSRKSKGRYNY